ncbi:MAG: hydroxymethylglutaryl-CoA synthase family protein [Candidatus Aminicenantes bacterium]|nr:MAG: hydroxymethylglutaryl-CoA synthase family protein [Candidatus Aminicenantes bacterium]
MGVGIEAINVYGGPAVLDVRTLFAARGLNIERFDNLMMEKKSVGLPCEDPVTNGVNAAKPIIDGLSEEEKNRIELVIASTESGLDFGKALSTYIQDHLGLGRSCRSFELKHACYAGTAAIQMAACFAASDVSPGAKALVIATDTARAAGKGTYGEPSQAIGAVAVLVSNRPKIMEIDLGAAGCHSYEVMDAYRPLPGYEVADPDLSLLSYLDCLENCYRDYEIKVEGVNFLQTFDYLAFHTPFAGMVKGAHRQMMRKFVNAAPEQIEKDFRKRVAPSLQYCIQIGNVYSATLYIALCGLIDSIRLNGCQRVGLFSYGSGCSSEFYSGLISSQSQEELAGMKIQEQLNRRYRLNMEEYDRVLDLNAEWLFGIQDKETDISPYSGIYEHFMEGRGLLVLKRIKNFHREYDWS